MEKNIMVTVSGGRSSAMAARHIQTHEDYADFKKIYLFANTGQERVETIDFLKNIIKYWEIDLVILEAVGSEIMDVGITYKVVTFETMSMNSEPFEEVVKHKNKGVFSGLPIDKAPYCSNALKTIPCEKYANDIFGKGNYIKSIGYRYEDMPKRITWKEIAMDKKRIFPLLTDFGYALGQQDLNKFWEKQPFKLQIHGKYGNCELCWKKSKETLIENIRFGVRSVPWWQRMEETYGNVSFRENLSINDLVRMAELPTTGAFDFESQEDSCVCNF